MRLSVFGIGYVGAVSAACLARDGHDLIAVDSNRAKVDVINAGDSPIVETGLADLIRQAVYAKRLKATTDAALAVAETSLSIVCVGTPSLPNGNLDLSQVRRVCEEIGHAIGRKRDRHTVVIRSTMLPGSMSSVVMPILEASSGRRLGEEMGAAIYPEFLREGSAIRDYDEAGTVVIGVDDEGSLAPMRQLVGKAADRAIVLNTATAEMVKYANNA